MPTAAARYPGVPRSAHQLPVGPWPTLLTHLLAQFASVGEVEWRRRFAEGEITDANGQALAADSRYQAGGKIYYCRVVANERPAPAGERILYQDAHLLVADKPHFLPVMPAGEYVQHTLLVRLRALLGNDDLVPLHRIDRETAGLVLFSTNAASRGRYAELFAHRQIAKTYHAVAPYRPELAVPCEHHSHICRSEQYLRMQVKPELPANSHTRIELLQQCQGWGLYQLQPVSGRRHQLRVQMAALGAALLYDRLYGHDGGLYGQEQGQGQGQEQKDAKPQEFSQPLQLLARELQFCDPLTGQQHHFCSQQQLQWPPI